MIDEGCKMMKVKDAFAELSRSMRCDFYKKCKCSLHFLSPNVERKFTYACRVCKVNLARNA